MAERYVLQLVGTVEAVEMVVTGKLEAAEQEGKETLVAMGETVEPTAAEEAPGEDITATAEKVATAEPTAAEEAEALAVAAAEPEDLVAPMVEPEDLVAPIVEPEEVMD